MSDGEVVLNFSLQLLSKDHMIARFQEIVVLVEQAKTLQTTRAIGTRPILRRGHLLRLFRLQFLLRRRWLAPHFYFYLDILACNHCSIHIFFFLTSV